ncbi:MAG TPA: hypothetical protein VF735_06625 [Pyrinomonadaceae bacterium]|jgi:hypothetical protein
MSHENIPDYEPQEIIIGETLEWTKVLTDFPASEWTLSYYVRGAGKGFDVAATASGDTHEVTVAASVTAEMSAGAYYWQAWVAKDSEKHLVDQGAVLVKQGFVGVAVATTVDARSTVKKILDAIDAMMLGKATLDQQEYMIQSGTGARQLKRIPISELLTLRATYAQLYAGELRAAKLKAGAPYMKNILVRFDRS